MDTFFEDGTYIPEDAFQVSDEAWESLRNASDAQVEMFHWAMNEFELDSLDVFAEYGFRELSAESRQNVETFLTAPPPTGIYIEYPTFLIEVYRKTHWGLWVAQIVFFDSTQH